MARLGFLVDLQKPIRALLARFNRAERNLERNRQAMLRTQAKQLQAFARFEAPQGKTGRFRLTVEGKAFENGAEAGIQLVSGRPLGKWIRFGTEPHPIPKTGTATLHFFWPNGPRGAGFYVYRRVQHPGTKPNDFAERAVTRWLPVGRRAFRQVGLDFVTDLRR